MLPYLTNRDRGGQSGSGSNRGRGGRGRGRGRGRARERTPRQQMLAAVAQETLAELPKVLKLLPDLKVEESIQYNFKALSQVDQATCPKLPKTPVKVVNQDSFNAAIDVATRHSALGAPRVAVLNLASHRNPGGGWLNGSTAQEEALCYRSSLYLSLHKSYYPWKKNEGIYTGDVLVIRTGMDDGHALMTSDVAPRALPVFSVLSVAALARPEVKTVTVTDKYDKDYDTHTGSDAERPTKKMSVLARDEDKTLTKEKMRLTLRMAAVHGHRALVLGALGCGAFHNPPEEIAEFWLEVLQEEEFEGGWWEEICFAVYDRRNEGNFETFRKVLDGKLV